SPQVPRRDPELRQPAAGKRDLGIELEVALLAGLGTRRKQPELLELACEPRVDSRALAQLSETEFVLLADQPAAPALAVTRAGGGKLLADDAQRQELVALEAQNRLEALEVVLAEEAVPALGPARRQQSLILEAPDLRDRDVRELVLEHAADGSDRQQTRFRCVGLQWFRNVSRYLPFCSSSPSSSCTVLIS